MKNSYRVLVALMCFSPMAADGAQILLDGETPATGSNLDSSPLVTTAGTISFIGTVLPQYDRDLPSGNTFSTDNGAVSGTSGTTIEPASFIFDFDVQSVTFVYGGNSGGCTFLALDGDGTQIDSFTQNDTGSSQPIGPVTLSGVGIREIRYHDPRKVLANLDNIHIEAVAVPEPSAFVLLATGALGLLASGWRWRQRQ